MDYFIFKGIDSRNIPGLVVNSLPPITKAAKRIERIEIDGKDGDITEEKGYKPYDKPLTITLLQDYDVNVLINWLNGSGKLILSNEDDKYYEAEIVEQINFERLFKYLPVKVIFHVQPYKYLVGENVNTIEKVLSEEAEELELIDYAGGEGSLSINRGNTKQNSYEGNQLIDFKNAYSTSRSTYTFVNDILTVESDGTEDGGYNQISYNINDVVKNNPGKKLRFSYKSVDLSNFNSTSSVVAQIVINGSSFNQIARKNTNTSLTLVDYTIPSDTSIINTARCIIYTNNTSTPTASKTIIEEPMLQFGIEEKKYEPYVGRSSIT